MGSLPSFFQLWLSSWTSEIGRAGANSTRYHDCQMLVSTHHLWGVALSHRSKGDPMDLIGKGSKSVEGEPQLWVSNPRPPGMACTSTRKASLKFTCGQSSSCAGVGVRDQPLEIPCPARGSVWRGCTSCGVSVPWIHCAPK